MIYRDEKRKLKVEVARMWTKETDRHIVAYAEDGLPGVERFLNERQRQWQQQQSQDSGNRPSNTWDLNAGYKGAVRMAHEGWSEGAADIETRLQAIMPAAGRESRWGYSVAGSTPNIGRFLRGNPNNMKTRKRRQSGSAPVFHIVVNSSASCCITGEQMKNYGVALVGLIDRLETAGRRVILDVMFGLTLNGDTTKIAVGWNVKKAHDHIDLGAIAFSVAHPAAFRRLGFAMLERLPKETDTWGYGHPADISPEDMPDYTHGMMLLDGVSYEPNRCNSPADALRMAIEQINKAAVLAGHATPEQPLIDDEMLEGL